MVSKRNVSLVFEKGKKYHNGFFLFEFVERITLPHKDASWWVFKNPQGTRVVMSAWDVNINFEDSKTSHQKKWSH